MTNWQPTNNPGRYDKARLAHLKPLKRAIEALDLPPIRLRKLYGILNALEMQIEDGGDNPDVNNLLLAALKAGVQHQVGEQQPQEVIHALETFARVEAERWRQVQAGTLPPVTLSALEQLDEFIQAGYDLLARQEFLAACDQWLAAWDLVRQMTKSSTKTTSAFDAAYPQLLHPLSIWIHGFYV